MFVGVERLFTRFVGSVPKNSNLTSTFSLRHIFEVAFCLDDKPNPELFWFCYKSVSCSPEVYSICMQSRRFDFFEKLTYNSDSLTNFITNWYCFLHMFLKGAISLITFVSKIGIGYIAIRGVI